MRPLLTLLLLTLLGVRAQIQETQLEGSGSNNGQSNHEDDEESEIDDDNEGHESDEDDEESEEGEDNNDEEGSGDSREVTVVESADYNMGTIGEATLELRMDRLLGKDKLQMVCDMSKEGLNLTKSECPPLIYLVQGHTSCYSLPDEVPAQKMATIEHVGKGEVQVDITWEDLRRGCIIVLQDKSCSLMDHEEEEGKEGGDREDTDKEEGEIEEGGEEERDITEEAGGTLGTGNHQLEQTSHNNEVEVGQSRNIALLLLNTSQTELDVDTVEVRSHVVSTSLARAAIQWLTHRRQPRRHLGNTGSLRKVEHSLGRVFTTLTLTDFTLLSVGSTGAFTVFNKAYPNSYFSSNIVKTQYNPWATWPIIQLPGVTSTQVALIILGMMFLFYGFSIISSPSSRHRLRRIVQNGDFEARVDALNVGVADVLHRTAVETPYKFLKDVAFRIDRGLLRQNGIKNRYLVETRTNRMDYTDYQDIDISPNTSLNQGEIQERDTDRGQERNIEAAPGIDTHMDNTDVWSLYSY